MLILDGTPENVPMYPFEINTRLSGLSLGSADKYGYKDTTALTEFDNAEIVKKETPIVILVSTPTLLRRMPAATRVWYMMIKAIP